MRIRRSLRGVVGNPSFADIFFDFAAGYTIALGAFSVFFTQSPSFLEYQKKMEKNCGKSNAKTIFGIKRIPTDNHIRDILDPVSPQIVFPVYNDAFSLLNKSGHIDSFRGYSMGMC